MRPTIEILGEANTSAATHGPACLIGLVVIVAAIFAISYHTLPRVERAYQMEKV